MRLIDAEQLVMHLSDYALQESPGWGSDDWGNKDAYDAISNCILAVQEAPTVEAVAIVKCRDCKYFRATDPVDTFTDTGSTDLDRVLEEHRQRMIDRVASITGGAT